MGGKKPRHWNFRDSIQFRYEFFRMCAACVRGREESMKRRAIANWSCFCFGLVFLAATQTSPAKDKDKNKQPEPYALLSGTCFDGRGFRLAGASVQAELTSEPSVKLKKKKWETISSPRGEFAIRLPAGSTRFRVSAAKDGFQAC